MQGGVFSVLIPILFTKTVDPGVRASASPLPPASGGIEGYEQRWQDDTRLAQIGLVSDTGSIAATWVRGPPARVV